MDTNKPSGDEKTPKEATKPVPRGGPQAGGAPNPEPIEFLGVLHEAPGTKPVSALPMDTPRDPHTNQPPSAHPNPMAGKDQITASTVGRALGGSERASQNPMAGRGPTPIEAASRAGHAAREQEEEKGKPSGR